MGYGVNENKIINCVDSNNLKAKIKVLGFQKKAKIKKNGVNSRFLTVNVRSSITGWPRLDAIVGAFQRFCQEQLSPYA